MNILKHYQVPEKPYMKRRDFFARLAQASADLLGSNPFHGSLDGVKYSFIPGDLKELPTMLVVGNLQLNEETYKDKFNLIYISRWPSVDRLFWRKLLLRHDLLDEIYILCRQIPPYTPSFFKKIVCFEKNSIIQRPSTVQTIPTLLFIRGEDNFRIPEMTKIGATGSDVFVGFPGGLNTKNSPSYKRLCSFYNAGD